MSEADQDAVSVVASPRLFRGETVVPALGVYLPTMAAFRFVGLIRNVVLAWLISEGQFGLLLLALLVINVLSPIASLGLHEAVARYVPVFESRGALRSYLRRVVPLLLVSATTVAAVLVLAAEPVGNWLFRSLAAGPPSGPQAGGHAGGEIAEITRWVAAAMFALAIHAFVIGILRGLRMFRALSLMELTQTLLFTGAAIVVACVGWNSAKAVIISYAAAVMFIVVVFTVALRRRLHNWPEQQESVARHEPIAGRALRFGLWTAVAAVAWQLLQTYPTWYLNKVHGHEAIAVFGGVRTIAQGVLLAATPVITVVTTMVIRAWEIEGHDSADRRFRLAFKTTTLFLLAGSAVLAGIKHQIMRLFPGTFAPGEVVIQFLLLFFLLAADLTFLLVHFNLIEKPRLSILPWSVGIATNVVVAWFWVRPAVAGHTLSATEQLVPTAKAAVVAMAVALALCLLLLRMERRPVDRGSWIMILAGFALCLPCRATIAIAVGLLILARPLVLTREEMAALLGHPARLLSFARRRASAKR